MAIFRKKPPDDDRPNGDDAAFEPQPEKARKWFDHARVSEQRAQLDYALTCFASGIRLDPSSMAVHEEMFEAARKYHVRGGKPASSKEVRAIDGPYAIAKFAAAEFVWMMDLENGSAALKALAAAVKAEQLEFGRWLAPRLLMLLRKSRKPSKGPLLQAKDLMAQVGAWNEAIAAGEAALQIDPSDSALSDEIKDLSAQRTMDQGGYEDAMREGSGGFKHMVKDLDKQRELEEEESIAGGSSVEERNLERARRDYEENPGSPDALNKYAQLLRRQGTPEAEEEALRIFTTGFEATGEYRFRMAAGDLRIEQIKRRLRALEERLEASPDDVAVKSERDDVRHEYLDLRRREFGERVAKYPTDRHRKFELGEVEFELGNFEEAMEQFQKSKDEPKLRVRAGMMLGRCFAREGWHRDAVAEFRDTLEAVDGSHRDLELDVKYELMGALLAQAHEDQSLDLAKDALEICSEIVRRDISFRDVRSMRKEIDTLIKELG